jgi:hypothetical protein
MDGARMRLLVAAGEQEDIRQFFASLFARRTGKSGKADWRDARSQCHTSVWHDGLSTPKTFPAKHAADSQAPPGTTPGVPLSGSR